MHYSQVSEVAGGGIIGGVPQSAQFTHAAAWGGAVRVLSPGDVQWVKYAVPVGRASGAAAGLRFLHISDLHLGGHWFAAYDRLIAEANSREFDLIALTGDLIDNRWNPSPAVLNNLRRFLDGLRARVGVFAILGNHDGDLLAPYVARSPVTLLHPGIARINLRGCSLEFIGLPCVHRTDLTPRLLRRIGPKPPGVFRVVLSHYPDHVLKIGALMPDLILAGHTHGGQVCLPTGRPIITHDRLPSSMSCGIHRVGDCVLIVSRGVGFATYPIRIFAPPQVGAIELVAEASPLIARELE